MPPGNSRIDLRGESMADHCFIPFFSVSFSAPTFPTFFYGGKLPSLGQHDTGEAAFVS